ncbi:type II toxin-antitoxin system HigB family toxin [Methylobacterium sp. JK268]
MRVVSNKALVAFAARHPAAATPLQAWRKIMESGTFGNFADLKRTFNAVDRVEKFYIFDIGGNKFRIIATIHFNREMLFIREVLTHKEYDSWKP